jgi:hypothetical protein
MMAWVLAITLMLMILKGARMNGERTLARGMRIRGNNERSGWTTAFQPGFWDVPAILCCGSDGGFCVQID